MSGSRSGRAYLNEAVVVTVPFSPCLLPSDDEDGDGVLPAAAAALEAAAAAAEVVPRLDAISRAGRGDQEEPGRRRRRQAISCRSD